MPREQERGRTTQTTQDGDPSSKEYDQPRDHHDGHGGINKSDRNGSAPSGGEMLGQLLAGLIGFAVVAVGALGAAKMVSGAPSDSPLSVGEGHFEFIAGLALLALIVFGAIFALGAFYWVTWKLTEAITTFVKRIVWGKTND